MSSWQCPYCGQNATILSRDLTTFDVPLSPPTKDGELYLSGLVIVCPNDKCREYELSVGVKNSLYKDTYEGRKREPNKVLRSWALRPDSRAKPFPSFIPAPLLEDYNEACAIENRSPKASATLSRRCLQGIIRNFYGIAKRTLFDEIAELKGRVSTEIWAAIDGLRELGNIGAHPEADINLIVDVQPEEAAALINLIELMFRITYVERQRDQQLLAEVTQLAHDKKEIQAAGKVAQLPVATPVKKTGT